jgi:probable rRNA maturation factor
MSISIDTNQEKFSITKKTKDRLPSLSFVLMKEKVLGKDYDLSLVFIDEKEIHELNKIHRNVNSPTDILSFPLDKKSGEIFICLTQTKKMAKEFDRSYENFLAFLFIHGLVHLLGYDHGGKMEKVEIKYRKVFRI